MSCNIERSIFTLPNVYTEAGLKKLLGRVIIHAGRYLDDKEFSYLGTIKVMADVYLMWTLVTYQV